MNRITPNSLVMLLALIASMTLIDSIAAAADNEEPIAVPEQAVVEGYAETLDVPEAAAEDQLETQNKGAGIVPQLEELQGGNYAGVWFDPNSGEFVVPMVPAANQSKVETSLDHAHLSGEYQSVVVDHTWDELEAAQREINERLGQLLSDQLVQTSLNAETNAVVIRVTSGASPSQRQSVSATAAKYGDMAEVLDDPRVQFHPQTRECKLTKAFEEEEWWYYRNCDKPLRAGVSINNNNGQCTGAFKATNAGGARYVLTAGHCAEGLSNWWAATANNTEHYLGKIDAYEWENGSDWAKIRVSGETSEGDEDWWEKETIWPSQMVYWGGGEHIPVEYESGAYQNEYICHSGTTSGSSCGAVTETGASIVYDAEEEGEPEIQINQVTLISGPDLVIEDGDSGGPIYAAKTTEPFWEGNTALGLLSGSEGERFEEGEAPIMYSMEIRHATLALGVSVGAVKGAPPYVKTFPAIEVQARQMTAVGQVDANGLSTTYRFDYGTTPSVESATPGYSGGADWPTFFVNQTIGSLIPNQQYYYRIAASNSAGEVRGEVLPFKTLAVPPVVTTKEATSGTISSTMLSGTVNAENAETEYWIEYGATTSYGTKSEVKVTNGLSTIGVSKELTGQTFGSTIHYRVVAKNAAGTTNGPDRAITIGWLPQTHPKISGSEWNNLRSVSCLSQSSCVGVGIYENTELKKKGLAERWNGGSWEQMAAVPDPSGSSRTEIEDVSCTAANQCTAVGYYKNGTNYQTVAERWNGTEWKVQETPNLSSFDYLQSVACSTSTSCMAVGYWVDKTSGEKLKAFAMQWNGTKWETKTTPSTDAKEGSPENEDAQLTGVSCSSSTACTAVGFNRGVIKGTEHYETVAMRWNGTSWSLQETPKVVEHADAWFEGVACPSATSCMAVGYASSGNPANGWETLAMQWNGTKWTEKTTPNYQSYGNSYLYDVSCASTTSCVAVGAYPVGVATPDLVRWNGTSWSVEYVQKPANEIEGINLKGISCNSSTACLAVGSEGTSSGSRSYLKTPAPTVATGSASAIAETTAEVGGTANANGTSGEYWFEYGTTTSYGTSTTKKALTGSEAKAVSAALSTLTAETTYHFRIAASNTFGTVYGSDQVFKTLGIGAKLAAMAVLDPFNGKAAAGSDFSKDWTALSWAGGTTPKGSNNENGWGPSDAFSTVNGASFKTSYTDSGNGVAAVVTMSVNPSNLERYFTLWIDMPTPGSAKSGYEVWFLRKGFENTYKVGLWKMVSGTMTNLGEKENVTFVNGNSLALVDKGSKVSVWLNTGSGFTEFMSGTDSTYSSGQVGVQGSGNITRLTNFKAGSL